VSSGHGVCFLIILVQNKSHVINVDEGDMRDISHVQPEVKYDRGEIHVKLPSLITLHFLLLLFCASIWHFYLQIFLTAAAVEPNASTQFIRFLDLPKLSVIPQFLFWHYLFFGNWRILMWHGMVRIGVLKFQPVNNTSGPDPEENSSMASYPLIHSVLQHIV